MEPAIECNCGQCEYPKKIGWTEYGVNRTRYVYNEWEADEIIDELIQKNIPYSVDQAVYSYRRG